MNLVVSLLIGTVQALLFVVELCFLVRAVLSFFPLSDSNPLITFTAMVTEPIIMPIRALFDRFGWFRNFPLDVPFFVAFILVNAVSSLLVAF